MPLSIYNTPHELIEALIAPYREEMIKAFITMPDRLHYRYEAENIEVIPSHITSWDHHYVAFRDKAKDEQVFVTTLEKALSLAAFALNEDKKALRRIIESAAARIAENYVQAVELDHISEADSWVFDGDAWEAPFELLASDMHLHGWTKDDTDNLWQQGRSNIYHHLRETNMMPELARKHAGLFKDLRLFLVKGLQHYSGPEDLHRWMSKYRAAGYTDEEIMGVMMDFTNMIFFEEVNNLNAVTQHNAADKWATMPPLKDIHSDIVNQINAFQHATYSYYALPTGYEWYMAALAAEYTHEQIMEYVQEKFNEWNDIPF